MISILTLEIVLKNIETNQRTIVIWATSRLMQNLSFWQLQVHAYLNVILKYICLWNNTCRFSSGIFKDLVSIKYLDNNFHDWIWISNETYNFNIDKSKTFEWELKRFEIGISTTKWKEETKFLMILSFIDRKWDWNSWVC